MEYWNKLTMGQKLVLGGALVMLIASILPWYKVSFDLGPLGSSSVSRNGWQSPGAIWSILAVLISLGFAGLIVAKEFGNVTLPDLGGFTWGQAALAAGALVALCIVIKLINESSHLSIGFFVGIIAAAAVAAGGYFRYTEEGAGGVRRA
jgi:hypothetical protein